MPQPPRRSVDRRPTRVRAASSTRTAMPLVGLPHGTVVAADSPLYSWFDRGSGRYSTQSPEQAVVGGRGYWAWFRCPTAVAVGSGAPEVSFGLGAYRANRRQPVWGGFSHCPWSRFRGGVGSRCERRRRGIPLVGVGSGSERGLPDLGSRLALVSTDERALAVWTDTRAGTQASNEQDLVRALVEVVPPVRLSPTLEVVLRAVAALLALTGLAVLAGGLVGRREPVVAGAQAAGAPSVS